MFPAPLRSWPPAARVAYVAALASSLAVGLTSVRPEVDLARGNVWGWPSEILFGNYAAVLAEPRMGRFIVNSFLVTVPAVLAAVGLSSMAGFVLAQHDF